MGSGRLASQPGRLAIRRIWCRSCYVRCAGATSTATPGRSLSARRSSGAKARSPSRCRRPRRAVARSSWRDDGGDAEGDREAGRNDLVFATQLGAAIATRPSLAARDRQEGGSRRAHAARAPPHSRELAPRTWHADQGGERAPRPARCHDYARGLPAPLPGIGHRAADEIDAMPAA